MRSRKPEAPRNRKQGARWNYEPVPNKAARRGFIAGSWFGAWVHYINRASRPCKQEMTERALVCEHCERGLVPEWRGYVPWWNEDYAPYFSIIPFEYADAVSEIPHLAQIVLRRGASKTDPCVIRQENWRATPIPVTSGRAAPVDLSDFCVHTLWKDDALAKWDLNQPKHAPEPVAAPVPTTPKKKATMYTAAHSLIESADPAVPLSELFGGTLNRVKQIEKAHQNGKMPKPKG